VVTPSLCSFHSSAPRWTQQQEEEKEEGKKKPEGTPAESTTSNWGINPVYAIPIGVAAAVPILQFQWYLPDEQTLLASTFLGFCVVAYTQGGQLIANTFKEESNALLKAQNEAEDQVIAKLEETVQYMKLTENIVSDYQAVYDLTEASYAKLNQAGKIKPQHDLKAQIEKMLTMIANEERSSYEKAKVSLMAEATQAVMKKFLTDNTLKQAALSAAVNKLTGGKGGGGGGGGGGGATKAAAAAAAASDPVQAAFVDFFKEKAKAAKATDDGSEEKAARVAMLAKMNAIASAENMFFRFDETTGQPYTTMTA
jgi:hypothetical protein